MKRFSILLAMLCGAVLATNGCVTSRPSSDEVEFTAGDIAAVQNLLGWFFGHEKQKGRFRYHFPNATPEQAKKFEKPIVRYFERTLESHEDKIPLVVRVNKCRLMYAEYDKATGSVVFYPRKKPEAVNVIGVSRMPEEVHVVVELPWFRQMALKFRSEEKKPKRLEVMWCISI